MLGAWQCRQGCGAPLPCPPAEPLQPRSGFSHPPANSNCVGFQLLFFPLSSRHVFPISERARQLGPLLLSPALILFPDGPAGAVPAVTGSPVPSCHLRGKPHWEGEVDGKFCFSESSTVLHSPSWMLGAALLGCACTGCVRCLGSRCLRGVAARAAEVTRVHLSFPGGVSGCDTGWDMGVTGSWVKSDRALSESSLFPK